MRMCSLVLLLLWSGFLVAPRTATADEQAVDAQGIAGSSGGGEENPSSL